MLLSPKLVSKAWLMVRTNINPENTSLIENWIFERFCDIEECEL